MTFEQAMARKIGKYEILGELGKGGFGSVFRAFDPTVGRVVAIKVLAPSDDPNILNRFRIEAKAAGNLHHPNIVTIHDFGDHEGRPYLVMEFMEGEDLQKAMARGQRLSLIEKIHIMVQVADGLHCAHQSGVIHRDVKPANIMLLPDNTVKIMDFGIARLLDPNASRQTQTGLLIGTIFYISPEQFQGWDGNVLADIWAYGVICYEIFTGANPFKAPDTAGVMYKITYVDPEPIQSLAPECPEALGKIVSRALAKKRELRYQSLEDLKYDLEPILLDLKKRHAEELLSQVNQLFDQGQLEEANAVVRKILNLDPANWSARQLRESIQKKLQRQSVRPRIMKLLHSADEEFGRRNFEAALTACEAARDLDPADQAIRARCDRAREAISHSKKALELLKNARKELQHHNLTNAFRFASEAARTDPTEPQAVDLLKVIESEIERRARDRDLQEGINKAQGLLLIDSFEEAIAVLSDLTSRYPESTVAAELLIQARTENLEREKRESLKRDLEAAKALVKKGRFSEAVEVLRPLPAVFPNNAEAARLLSYAEEELTARRRRDAIEQIHHKAEGLLASGKFDASIGILEDGLKAFSNENSLARLLESALAKKETKERESAIHKIKAHCEQLDQEGHIQEALQSMERAVEEYPGDSDLLRVQDRLQKAWEQYQRAEAIRNVIAKSGACISSGKPADALDLLERARFHYPDSTEIRDARARAAQLTQDQRERQFIDAQLARARDLEARQDFQSAIDVIHGALEQYPAASELKDARARLDAASKIFERNEALANQRRDIEHLIEIGCYADAAASISAAQKMFPDAAIFPVLASRVQRELAAERIKIEIAGHVREIQKAIDAGDFAGAVALIKNAQQIYPNEHTFNQLYDGAKRRFEEIRAAQQKQDAARRVKEIETSRAGGDFAGTFRLIEAAQQIHPADPAFGKLLEETKRAEQEIQAEQTKQEIAQRKAEIDRAVSAGDHKRAFELLAAGRRDYPAEIVFVHLLETTSRAQAEVEAELARKDVAARRTAITQAIADKDFKQANALITSAQQAHPKEDAFPQLRSEADRIQDEARTEQRKRESARAKRSIEQAIAAQDVSRASELINAAGREYPDQAIFNDLLERLNALVKQKDLEAAIAAVEASIESQEFEKARDLLGRALKLYPKEYRFRPLSSALEKAAKYHACMKAARREVEQHRFPAAEKSVREALKHKPEDSDALALLKTIESGKFEAEERKFYQTVQQEVDRLLGQRHFDLAARKVQQALVRFPRDPDLERRLQLAVAGREKVEEQRRTRNPAAAEVRHSGPEAPVAASGNTARIKWVAAAAIFIAMLAGGGLWMYERHAESARMEALEQARKVEIAKLTEQERIGREKLTELKRKEDEGSRARTGGNPQSEDQRKRIAQEQADARAQQKKIETKLAELRRLDQEKKKREQSKPKTDQERPEKVQAELDQGKVNRDKREQAQPEEAKQKSEQSKPKNEEAALGRPYTGAREGTINWSGELSPNQKLIIDDSGARPGKLTKGRWPHTEVTVDVKSAGVIVINSNPRALELVNKSSEPIARLEIRWTAKNIQ